MIEVHQPGEKASARVTQERATGRSFRLLFGLTIFISAFLLFQVQLILGKFLLPWFGGTSAVWTTCLLFFQVLLLGGYLYSHKVSSSLHSNWQGRVHLVVLALTAFWMLVAWYSWGSPFLPDARWKPLPGSRPIAGILQLLSLSVGLPFLLLSSTAPLLQKWYDQLHRSERNEPPYFLYALSNAGSALGLLSYPVILEPTLGLHAQSQLWGAGFFLFVLSCGICAWRARRAHATHDRSSNLSEFNAEKAAPVPPSRRWLWFALPALASVMLLATTNLLTQDVAPIPLLWILPLLLYLLSFVFTFQKTNWYSRGLFHPLFAITALMTTIALFRGTRMEILLQIGVFLGMLFTACMVCHGELARIKPAARYLTTFYLTLSAGGAFGGIFVGIIAPLTFPAVFEYHIALCTIAALLILILVLDRGSWLHEPRPNLLIPTAFLFILFLVPRYLAQIGAITLPPQIRSVYNLSLPIAGLVLVWFALRGDARLGRRRPWRWYQVTVATGFLLLSAALAVHLTVQNGWVLHRERNFYGSLLVQRYWDDDMLHSYVELLHGRIRHGSQLERDRKVPVTYYTEKSGVGLALTASRDRSAGTTRVGVIGLGVGTLAAYSRPGDVYRFYEINPAVIHLAQGAGGYFTYLKDSPAQIEIVPGDARLSLEAEAARQDFQNLDVLIVDAFHGDSIPIHLLTREAMELYLSHLRAPDSLVAIHISNDAVDLAPVVASLADLYDFKGVRIVSMVEKGPLNASDWILLTQGNSLDVAAIQAVAKPMRPNTTTPAIDGTAVWTDDYSNVVSLLKVPRHVDEFSATPVARTLTSRSHLS